MYAYVDWNITLSIPTSSISLRFVQVFKSNLSLLKKTLEREYFIFFILTGS